QNGFIAIESRRSTPTAPVAAAVVSEPIAAPISTPWLQSRASITSGSREGRRPPNTIALIGTPCAASAISDQVGHCLALTVKREFGCAAGPFAGSYGRPCQSVTGVPGRPSHHGWLSAVTATLVKIVSCAMDFSALGLLLSLVPGATPKKPASGLIAYSRPSAPGRIQQMSSPTVHTFQPSLRYPSGGISMARLVLPQAEGKAAAT